MQKTEAEKSKLNYWQKRAVAHLPEMRAAKTTGLFPRKEGWRNVVEHELVEAEAGDVLAEMLNLSIQSRQEIYHAALVHDVFKRIETEMIKEKGSEGYQISQAEQADFLRQRGYSERVINLTKSVGGDSLVELLENPEAEQLKVKTDVDLATMIVHYIDDITLNNELVPLKKRIEYLVNNPRYQEGNEKGKAIFAGRTYFEVQEEVSRQIEERLANMLSIEKSEELPGIIKNKILKRIDSRSTPDMN